MSLSETERKALHGAEYVEKFETQNPKRVLRLLEQIDFQKHHAVCDFGCGNAMALGEIHDRIGRYAGVDFSPEFIEKARMRAQQLNASHAEFYCEDIIGFCQTHPAEFDIALAFDFSEHVYDDDWLEFLSAMKNSLKPNGRIFLHTPNRAFFIELMKEKNFILKQFPEHIAVRSMEDNVALVERSGLEVQKQSYIPHYNALRHLHPFSALPWLGKYFDARIFIEARRAA